MTMLTDCSGAVTSNIGQPCGAGILERLCSYRKPRILAVVGRSLPYKVAPFRGIEARPASTKKGTRTSGRSAGFLFS